MWCHLSMLYSVQAYFVRKNVKENVKTLILYFIYLVNFLSKKMSEKMSKNTCLFFNMEYQQVKACIKAAAAYPLHFYPALRMLPPSLRHWGNPTFGSQPGIPPNCSKVIRLFIWLSLFINAGIFKQIENHDPRWNNGCSALKQLQHEIQFPASFI